MALWLYLHFPELQLNSLFVEEQTKPVIVWDEKKNNIQQCNDVASNAGIKVGMGLGTAASLCQDLQILSYSYEKERARLQEIAHWLYLITSDICLFEPNGLLLQVSNMLTLYEGLDHYWQALKTHLSETHCQYHFSTGYSPLAARLLARSGLNQVTDKEEILLTYLHACNLRDTDLSARQSQQLFRVGVKSLSDLLSIPVADLAKRFNTELLDYVGKLTGKFRHPVDFYHPPESFHRSLELLFEVENLSLLEKPLFKLLSQLEDFLKIRDMLAQELQLTLHLRDSTEQVVSTAAAEGEYLSEKWWTLFQLRFESVSVTAPIISVALAAVRMAPRRSDKRDLFDSFSGNVSPKELISILQAKLGQNAVQGVRLIDDHRPEFSTQLNTIESHAIPSMPTIDAKLRPSILHTQPMPLKDKVYLVQGPERLTTGWWDEHKVIRDYFIARGQDGRWLWVFRTPKQQWFVHGVFA